jgi:hypothetical protein
MTARDQLRHLVDTLPEDEAAALLAAIEKGAGRARRGAVLRPAADVAAGV